MQKGGKEDWLHCYPSKVDRASWILLWEKGPLLLPIGRFSTLVFVRLLLTNITQQNLLENQTHMKPNQIKTKFLFERKCFGLERNRKTGGYFFFYTSSLFETQDDTYLSLITDTNPLTNICVSLSLTTFAVSFSYQATISNGFFAGVLK